MEKLEKKRIADPEFDNLEKALAYMQDKLFKVPGDVMSRWVKKLLCQPGIILFLVEKVRHMKPLKRQNSEFPLWGRGEGFDDDDFDCYDDSDPRNLLLEVAPRLTDKGQSLLFGLPGAEAYFIEIAKTGRKICAQVQQQLLKRQYGKNVLKMYVYQGGILSKMVSKRYTTGDLLYGV